MIKVMDSLELAIMRGRLQQIADEMDLVHQRAAFSPVVSEQSDRSNSLIDPQLLEVVSQGATGLPIFVSTMQASARACLDQLGSELDDGDVIIMNDPYLGGTHLQDVKLLRPFYVDGDLSLLLINTGHLVDVGGAYPGGFDPGATDIFQEGIRIPPAFLVKAGKPRSDLLQLILQNTRLASSQEGDLRAQLNALEVGHRRLTALVAERGAETLRQAITELADRSEQQMRSYLRRIPDGAYPFTDYVEIDDERDLTLAMTLRVNDGDVTIDFTGSSTSYSGPANLARHTTETAVLAAFKHMFPEVPINGGCFRPFSFVFPMDSFVSAQPPRPVGGYAEGSQRVMESVFGALADALPEAAAGATFGSAGVLTLAGNKEDGSFFATVFPLCGGYGGSADGDGLVHGPTPIGLARFPKLEASEHDYPIQWECLEIRPDSAGAGRARGGPGTIYRLRVLGPMQGSFLGDRARHAPFGVGGGMDGSLFEIRIEAAGTVIAKFGMSRVRAIPLQLGDVIEWRSPGGAGFGPPSERPQEMVDADLANGIYTQWTYGGA
jgi:N-methylhydantoinase B